MNQNYTFYKQASWDWRSEYFRESPDIPLVKVHLRYVDKLYVIEVAAGTDSMDIGYKTKNQALKMLLNIAIQSEISPDFLESKGLLAVD